MSFLIKTAIYILTNAVAILVADRLISGFIFRGNWFDLIIAGAVLGIINSFVRPLLKFIALPIIFLTLGLFTVIINIASLMMTASLLNSLSINGFWAGFWSVIVISLVNHIIMSVSKSKES